LIKVEVRYFATFRKKGIKKEILSLESDSFVKELLKKADIEEKEVAILLVNGIKTTSNTKLNDGDVVSLFPPVGGG
jgi:molybdopterin converting factor small subunit